MSDRSQYGHGYTFPCLFRIGDDGWVLVSETGVDSRYCGSRLSDVSEGNLYTVAFPMAAEKTVRGLLLRRVPLRCYSLAYHNCWRNL